MIAIQSKSTSYKRLPYFASLALLHRAAFQSRWSTLITPHKYTQFDFGFCCSCCWCLMCCFSSWFCFCLVKILLGFNFISYFRRVLKMQKMQSPHFDSFCSSLFFHFGHQHTVIQPFIYSFLRITSCIAELEICGWLKLMW